MPGAIVLRCVECGAAPVVAEPAAYACVQCGARYRKHERLGTPVFLSSRSPIRAGDVLAAEWAPADEHDRAACTHWATGDLKRLLPSANGKRLLSYGSGEGADRRWLEEQGFSVSAFDVYPGPCTDYVCDGHELPFAGEQFDVVTSIAVFEHLYDPFRAAAEICRVLKKGGVLVGSVAFLEAYHARSYFHMSHLGLREVLRRAGFADIVILPGWSGLEAIHSRFWIWNKVPFVRRVTLFCCRRAHRFGLWLWKIGYRLKGKTPADDLELTFAGSLLFRATKPN